LDERFGAGAGAAFAEALRGITDMARLSELHRLAVRCRSVAEFRRALTGSRR
jgi:hypothetical protein